jgi:MoaA/NifB/PqqE/SkfB family radical SAM enzyme
MCDIWKKVDGDGIRLAELERHQGALRRLGVKWLVFTGGEPLMHSDVSAISEFFRKQGIRVTLLTTGLLLARRAAEVAQSFDDVIVSLDGPPEIHDHIRRVRGAYALIQEGIAAVRHLDSRLPISCRTTVQKVNRNHLRATVSTARSLALSSISFLAADVSSEAFNRTPPWSQERQGEVGLSSHEVAELEHEMARLLIENVEDIRCGFIAEDPGKLRRIVDHFRARLGLKPPVAPVCNAPWVSAVMEADGSVRPCFFHRAIGSWQAADLDDVLNGAEALKFRDSLDVATNPICQRCVCSLHYSTATND